MTQTPEKIAEAIVDHNVYFLRSVAADILDGWLHDEHQHRRIAAEKAALAAALHDLWQVVVSATIADTSQVQLWQRCGVRPADPDMPF